MCVFSLRFPFFFFVRHWHLYPLPSPSRCCFGAEVALDAPQRAAPARRAHPRSRPTCLPRIPRYAASTKKTPSTRPCSWCVFLPRGHPSFISRSLSSRPLPPTSPLTRSTAPLPDAQWGCGEDGQLGLDFAPVTSSKCALDWSVPTPTALALPDGDRVARRDSTHPTKPILAGSRNSAVVARSGALYTWGWNSHDTLGLDTEKEWVKTPCRVAPFPSESEASPNASVKLATLGGWHASAITRDGRIYAWGGNEYGQAGVDAGAHRHDFVHVSLHVSIPAPVLSGMRVRLVACGGMNTFAVTEPRGEVYQWGMTVGSQKEPARAPEMVPGMRDVATLAAGMFHALALQTDGRVLSWGSGDYGQLGLGKPGNWDTPQIIEGLSRAGVVTVAAGGWHSAAITAGRVCYVWGRGEDGRLGLGEDARDKQAPTELKLPNRVIDAALGGTHTCLLDDTGAVLSFGRNNHGRLGRVVHGKWTGDPGVVVFPPPPGGGRWRVTGVAAGGRHTLATAVPVPAEDETTRFMRSGSTGSQGGSQHSSPMRAQS